MKTKLFVFLTIFAIVFPFFTACRNEEMDIEEEFVPGFFYNDSKPLTDILTRAYDLEELTDFFGQIPYQENSTYGNSNDEVDLTIKGVNEKFPIEALRRKWYSVYKVNEGGYFYVFWVKTFDPFPSMESDYIDDAMVYFTAYVLTLKSEKDFDSIKEGISTAEDVARIDPAFELSFFLSSGIPSYSLLDNGSIVEIWYECNFPIKSRSDLLVERIQINSEGSALSASSLSKVYSSDLP